MKKMLVMLATASAALAVPQVAYSRGLGAEATGGKAEDQWGAELGVSYRVSVGPIAIRPIVGAFVYRGNNDRYYMDSFSNGQTRCRDRTNGQFASDSKCNDVGAMFYGKLEATVNIPNVAELGAGARYMDEEIRPYGVIAIPLGPRVKVVGQGGDHYFSAGLRIGF